MSDPTHSKIRNLLVTNALLLGVVISLVAGILAVAGGSGLVAAFVSGGLAFGASVPVTLGVLKALAWL
jgi:hypothetical protein